MICFQTFLNYDELMMADKPGEKEEKRDNKEEKENVDNKVNGVTSKNTESLKVHNNETMAILKHNEGYVQEQSGGEQGIVMKHVYAKWLSLIHI